MKASELRIGNYVNVPREDQSPFRIDFFEFLHEKDCKVAKRSFIGKTEVHPLTWYFSDLKPIELTEEWLLKMGGEKLPHFTISNSIFLKTKRNQQLSFGCVGTPNLMVFLQEIENGNVTDLIAIHNWDYDGEMYVHQLQNLYFSLCGEELTIKN